MAMVYMASRSFFPFIYKLKINYSKIIICILLHLYLYIVRKLKGMFSLNNLLPEKLYFNKNFNNCGLDFSQILKTLHFDQFKIELKILF